MDCNILDVTCNINGLISWLWSYFQPVWDLLNNIISFIVSAITLVISFINSIISLFNAFYNIIFNFITPLFSGNSSAIIVLGIISACLIYVMFRRIWNIIADIEIMGWRLPKL